MQSSETVYKLSLSDGSRWRITSTGELDSWLLEFAGILGLAAGNGTGDAHLTFTSLHKDNSSGCTGDAEASEKPDWTDWKIYRQSSLNLSHNTDLRNFICEINGDKNDGDMKFVNMWISLQSLYLKAIENGGIPLHAALIERDDKGILIAGEGDTGKSTCAKRLQDVWKPLCDDETLVVLNNGIYRAHPFPTWSDHVSGNLRKPWNVEYSVPLSAIFFLEQSGRDEVLPLSRADAALLINSSAMQVCNHFYRDSGAGERRAQAVKVFDNACKLAEKTPCFILRASKDGRFWEDIEKVL